jgi:hypothetical protein
LTWNNTLGTNRMLSLPFKPTSQSSRRWLHNFGTKSGNTGWFSLHEATRESNDFKSLFVILVYNCCNFKLEEWDHNEMRAIKTRHTSPLRVENQRSTTNCFAWWNCGMWHCVDERKVKVNLYCSPTSDIHPQHCSSSQQNTSIIIALTDLQWCLAHFHELSWRVLDKVLSS